MFNAKIALCHDIERLGRFGEVQGIEEIKLLRSCFAGGVEGVITDMSGVFFGSGRED